MGGRDIPLRGITLPFRGNSLLQGSQTRVAVGIMSASCWELVPKVIVFFFLLHPGTLLRTCREMENGNIPSPDAYVKHFCEIYNLGSEFNARALAILVDMTAKGVRENDSAPRAAIALRLHAIQTKQPQLFAGIARMAKVTPQWLMDLVRDAWLQMGLQVEKE